MFGRIVSLFLVLAVPLVSAQLAPTDAEKCQLHCSVDETTSLATCNSHNPFGGCTYVVTWTNGGPPMYQNYSISTLNIYLGDMVTYEQSGDIEQGTVFALPSAQDFEDCTLEDAVNVVRVGELPSTIVFDSLNFYYYAIRNTCALGAKLLVGVYTLENGLQCHDHAHEGSTADTSCHCHAYEQIMCPGAVASDDSLYAKHISDVETNCGGMIAGTVTTCPSLCYLPMEILHLHYLECPSRVKDPTFLQVEATGSCHPAEANHGKRECPVVDPGIALPPPVGTTGTNTQAGTTGTTGQAIPPPGTTEEDARATSGATVPLQLASVATAIGLTYSMMI